MITLKKVNRCESWILSRITSFWNNHHIISFLVILISCFFTAAAFALVAQLALIGGSQIDFSVQNQYLSGEISSESYNALQTGFHLAVLSLNYVVYVATAIFFLPIIWSTYKIYKAYLKYKKDNL